MVLLVLTVLTVGAQQRIPCLLDIPVGGTKTRGALGYPNQDWDPERIYRQPVVLMSFSDMDFSMEDPVAYYNRVLNEPGYNEGKGQGCVADYFRDQSGGLFNLQFDIYGPFKVSEKAKSDDKKYYASKAIEEALSQLSATTDADFSIYDWDGDGYVNQIVFIAAGYCGNQVSGYLWPHTRQVFLDAPGKLPIFMTSVSCELWRDGSLCGIGTICHEFAHCIGLPDLYPSSAVFSVVDEWDLMDGGNYTDKGWCPPNFSALEKMLMGWATPTELETATTITGMKPVSEGGETYLIRNSGHENEYYLLENRRQTKWDYGIPGQGLAIFHVDYDREIWSNNDVNYNPAHFRYDLFHADGKDYTIWDPANDGKDAGKYTLDPWMRSSYLSTSVYPYIDLETAVINACLTDDSSPAATLYNYNADGVKLMQKSITNIQIASDGTISFDFMKVASGIQGVESDDVEHEEVWYDLQGRRLQGKPTQRGLYIHNGKKESIR